jgi:hypothetical protein
MNSPLLRSTLAGIAGFIGYGGWAMFANSGYGSDVAMRSGIVQGTYSLILTFLMTLVTERLFERLGGLSGGRVLTVTVVAGILFVSAYSIHMLVGTPEILMTILPGFVIGTIYTLVYVLGLSRATRSTS